MTDRQHIESLAAAFRRAIEESAIRSDVAFRAFPRGACGDASLLLSEFLRQHGFDNIDYVCGWDHSVPEHPRSHAWLEVGEIIVDITADQFDDLAAPPVLVTTGRKLHSRFPVEQRNPARLNDYDPASRAHLRRLYARVLECVPQSLGGKERNPPAK